MAGALKLAQATSQRAGTPNALRVGIVVAVSTAGVQVNIGGGVITAGLNGGAGAGVAPGAVVSVFKQGSSWQVQGIVSGPGQGAGTTQPLPSTNQVILPPASKQWAGAQISATNGNQVTGLTTASGTVGFGWVISNVWPKGHLIETKFGQISILGTVANFQTVLTLRENNSPTGSVWANTVWNNAVAGNGSLASANAYAIGDGAVHTLGLFVSAASSGTGTIARTVGTYLMCVDWGDASGVLVA
jgi:hypothetical protein